jgi:hypothetical protein
VCKLVEVLQASITCAGQGENGTGVRDEDDNEIGALGSDSMAKEKPSGRCRLFVRL